MTEWQAWGQPLYLLLLHANFLRETGEPLHQFTAAFRRTVDSVPPHVLNEWLTATWREKLVAAWGIAARRDHRFRRAIHDQLLASASCFCGQGFCVAPASFADPEAANSLAAYLQKFIPINDREYDQEWAAAALVWLDARLATARAAPFVDDPSLWTAMVGGRPCGYRDPRRLLADFPRLMNLLETINPRPPSTP